ncbi:MAG: hypothetical protein U0414_37400 [Polyangiaceae bacterium]
MLALRPSRAGCVALLLSSLFVLPNVASAQDDDEGGFSWDHQFRIKSDLRFRLEEKTIGAWYTAKQLPQGVERNQNEFGAKLSAKLSNWKAVADIGLTLFGYHDTLTSLGKLSQIEEVQPYRFDVNELFIEAKGFGLSDLDLKIGQQTVQWGVADQFNPTNNLNPDDLRDTLLFGKQAGNFMIKADYYVTEDFSWSGVLVPLFRPALLPETAPLQLIAIDRLPFVDPALRYRIHSERIASESSIIQHPTVVDQTTVNLPTPSFENMQASFRLAWTLAEQDFALSYYNGRNDFPVPVEEHTHADNDFTGCDPLDPAACAVGLLRTDVTFEYPRMHVYGLNIAGEFNPFKKIDEKINGIGYRFEGALIVPEKRKMRITQDKLDLTIPQPAGEYDYDNDGVPGGPVPIVVDDTPFFKWTLGLDYTFGTHVYVNLQWVHGLADEYGAGDWIFPGESVRWGGSSRPADNTALQCALPRDGTTCAKEITRPRIGDFLVVGTDVHFLDDAALARLFLILEMSGYDETYFDLDTQERVSVNHPFVTPEGFSAVIYPEFDYNFGNGFNVGAGFLFLLGKDYTKFGDPTAGGSLAFLKASYAL